VLEVTANADSALVYVDDVLAGSVPLLKVLEAGYHVIRVAHPSFAPVERRLLVPADTAVQLNAELERQRSGLHVRVDVPGARVLLDGKQIGVGDVIVDPVRAGSHVLTVEARGFQRYEAGIEVAPRTMTPIRVNLSSTQSSLDISTVPLGATVFLDGKSMGVTPLKLDSVRPGNHAIKCVLEGRATALQSLILERGEQRSLALELPLEGGGLQIRVRPSAAEVSLHGTVLGTGNQRVSDLAPGMYVVRATSPGYLDAHADVEVVAGKNVRLKLQMRPFAPAN